MIKKLLLTLLLLIIVIAAGVYFYYGAILTRGIENVGSRVLGTQVKVASASLLPLSGTANINGLTIANPEGWVEEHVFRLGDLDVELDIDSIFSDVIIINSIVIRQPRITYETKITNDNIRDLMANISGSGSSENTNEAGASAKQIVIRDFQLLEPTVHVVSAIDIAPLVLPDLHLRNIGEQSNAVTIADASRQILSAISRSVLNSSVPSLDILRENVEQRLNEAREDVVEEVEERVEEVQNRLRGLLPN